MRTHVFIISLPLQIPGLDDVHSDFDGTAFGHTGRHRGGRVKTTDDTDIQEIAQTWQASAASMRVGR